MLCREQKEAISFETSLLPIPSHMLAQSLNNVPLRLSNPSRWPAQSMSAFQECA